MLEALGAAPAWFPWSRTPQLIETEACHSSPHRWNAPLIMTQAIVECTSDSQRRRGWGEKGGVKVQTKGSLSVIKFVEGQKELQSFSSGHVEGEERGYRTSFFVSEHKFLLSCVAAPQTPPCSCSDRGPLLLWAAEPFLRGALVSFLCILPCFLIILPSLLFYWGGGHGFGMFTVVVNISQINHILHFTPFKLKKNSHFCSGPMPGSAQDCLSPELALREMLLWLLFCTAGLPLVCYASIFFRELKVWAQAENRLWLHVSLHLFKGPTRLHPADSEWTKKWASEIKKLSPIRRRQLSIFYNYFSLCFLVWSALCNVSENIPSALEIWSLKRHFLWLHLL